MVMAIVTLKKRMKDKGSNESPTCVRMFGMNFYYNKFVAFEQGVFQ